MRWEYKVLKVSATGFWVSGKVDQDELERELNRLGVEGWELVSAFDTSGGQGYTRDVFLTLKRPAGEARPTDWPQIHPGG